MNKWQKEVLNFLAQSEEDTLKALEKEYKRALNEIGKKVKEFQTDIDMLDAAIASEGLSDAAKAQLQTQRRSKIYQKRFQEALQGQVNGILDRMQGATYSTIEAYLKRSYEDSFIGTMYDIAGQGIPLIVPIDQAAAIKAVLTDSKVSKGLYNALGVDVAKLKRTIRSEISRGIATSLPYSDIARNITNVTKAPMGRAKTIVRTEGHRIQQASTMDAQNAAKARGADVVKQWDASLDSRTRETHRRLDGQIRELEEPFEIGGREVMAPGYFGDPAEDCNCRCVSLTRARWALDEDELQTLKDRAEYFGLDKTKDFEDFKKKYIGAVTEEQDFSEKIYSKISKKSLAEAKTTVYNKSPTQEGNNGPALKAYTAAIQSGEVSPLASFELFQAVSKEIDDLVVGLTTKNGIVVKSKSYHFIVRTIGSVEQRRSGVTIENIVQTLTEPDRIDAVMVRENGKSQRLKKNGVCSITINPDTGNLIQVNPLR